jgi:hypothetical protein
VGQIQQTHNEIKTMFDIHQAIWSKHGEIDDARVGEYIDGLMEEFAASPEAQPIIQQYGNVAWSAMMMEYAVNYLGHTPPSMSLADFNEVVFDLFPRKVSTEPDSAEAIVIELKAFWTFVDRQYNVPVAKKILPALDDRAVHRLQEKLADPSNYGMAKSFFMMGSKAGFDMTTQQGMDEFRLAYNAGILANRGLALPPPTAPDSIPFWTGPEPQSHEEREAKRKKRKQQRQARKRNRR